MKESRRFCPIRIEVESPQDAIDGHNNRLGRLQQERRRLVTMIVDEENKSRVPLLKMIETQNIMDTNRESQTPTRRVVRLIIGNSLQIPLPSVPLM